MTAIQQLVRRTIRRYALCPPGSRVAVGLSGGSDSVALALLLVDLAEHGAFSVVGFAHLNHRLRPGSADRDERFCREFSKRTGRPIVIESTDVQESAAESGLSLEEAARRIRYSFLERAADQLGADRIAVGHTQDDQAETVLMKLMRGAGLDGLAGIFPVRGRVVRPLLEVSNADLRSYLVGRRETWVEDETNADLANPRNRIRHRVLPELELALGGAVRPSIARTAVRAREDGQWLDAQAEERFAALVRAGDGDCLELDAAGVLETPLPIRRRVIRRSLQWAAGGREVGHEHVELASDVAAGLAGGVDVPGGRLELLAGKVVLLRKWTGPR